MYEKTEETLDDISLPKSVQVDEIIEFYKDKEYESEEAENDDTNERKSILNIIKKTKKTINGDIHTDTYGLSQKGRIILYRLISLAICILIIVGAFVLAYYLPGNTEVITAQQDSLRNEEDYKSLKSRHDSVKSEIDNLKATNSDKESIVAQVNDYDNAKADLKAQISEKSYELNELNNQIKEKKNTLSMLDLQIDEKIPKEIILPAGKYVAGRNIAVGKHYVTGTGAFALSTAAGKSKINTTLTASPLEVTLEEKDIMKFNAKVKFTSAN